MDDNSNLIGMVYKRRKGYFRCRLTIKDKITPEFVGRALEQEPTIVEPQRLDVFQCREYYIRSDQILAGVAVAHEKIKEKLKIHDYGGFPALYKSTGNTGSTALYLWPLKITGPELYYRAKSSSVENMFAVIDDFSNVHNILMGVGGNELVDCERKTVDQIHYQTRLSNYSRKLTEYRALISNYLTPQTDPHRALAAGEKGMKGSTRPQKKQKLTTQ
ncbi:hypothetical protein K3495_g11018 [Podosphaera aphanis]|nr:hypothetical protein K3495_g11018 [Podosphaera aphanis]